MTLAFLHCLILTLSSVSVGNCQGSKSELYFMHEGSILQPGSSVVITDIGSQPTDSAQPGSTLVCVTTNVNRRCCSTNDNDGVVGNWRGPNGMLIMPHDRFSANDKFTSIASDEQVWLSRGSEVRGPTGKYTCEVPRQGNRNIITASITIITAPPTDPDPITTPMSVALITTPPTIAFPLTSITLTEAPTSKPVDPKTTAAGSDSLYTSNPLTTPSGGGGAILSVSSSTNPSNPANSSNPANPSNPFKTDTSEGDLRESQGDVNSGGVVAAVVTIVVVLLGCVMVATFFMIIWIRKKRAKASSYSLDDYLSFGKNDYVSPTVRPSHPKPFIATQSVETAAPVIEVFPESMYALEGEEVYLKVRVSGIPQPAITWTFNQQTISSDYSREIEDTGSITFPSCELSQTGTYTMVASNTSGKVQKLVVFTVRKKGEGLQETVDGGGVAGVKPVPIKEFGDYVAHLHSNNNKLFKSQFKTLDKGTGKSCAVSRHPDNLTSNRFADIIVYDDNRVVLKTSPGMSGCHGDYINASYIDGYSVSKKFIASQGPLPETLQAFWCMVWQERPPTIVMVTNLVEGAKEKCTQYWPEQGSMEVGPFTVTITDQHKLAEYTIRTFILQLKDDASKGKHKVRQFHFTSWPDHGVPDYASPLLTFYHRVCKEHPSNKGPIVCHCSAGVGRTGTFIGMDIILEQAMKEGVVNVVGVIKKMREQRVYMVQAVEQFVFLHDAVLESLTCGDTQISAGNLRTAMKRLGKVQPQTQTSGYDHEFKVLEQVSPRVEDAICSWAEHFPQLNRNTAFLPVDRWRLGLSNEFSSYLHATIANGYKQQKAFILAQTPLPTTIRNLWKVIYDSNVSAIVQLTELQEEGKEVCTQYWPEKKRQLREFKDFEVDLISEEEALAGFSVRNLSILEEKSQKAHQVTQFHITNWNGNGDCSNMDVVINMIDEVSKLQRRTGNHPIMIICNDTVTRCAMFCSIYNTIERCKLEGVVDVFQAVKSLRIHRPGAIQTVDQYKAIFEALLVFLDSFSDYSNFI